MKRNLFCSLATIALLLSLVITAVASGEKTKLTGYITDKKCSARGAAHTRDCTLKCKDGGLGLYVDGKFYEFDENGTEQAIKLMEASKSEKVLKVTVEGELDGMKLMVSSIVETE